MERERTYNERLFKSYRETHGDDSINLNTDNKEFDLYYDCYYKKYFDRYDKGARILEIGCNAGYMLETFERHGYNNILGIDLSPDDIEYAKNRIGGGKVFCIDAFDFLNTSIEKFDIIYTKAVMEHIAKDKIFEFLELINGSLAEEGIALIEVPNMDWIWAAHERYMDFTHEAGFTRESLRQIMRNFFEDVSIEYTCDTKRFRGIRTFFARKIIGPLLYWSEPCMSQEAIWARGVMGVGKKHSSEKKVNE